MESRIFCAARIFRISNFWAFFVIVVTCHKPQNWHA